MSKSIEQAIQELYGSPLEALELKEASLCLLEFFELLIETDFEQRRKGNKNNEIR